MELHTSKYWIWKCCSRLTHDNQTKEGKCNFLFGRGRGKRNDYLPSVSNKCVAFIQLPQVSNRHGPLVLEFVIKWMCITCSKIHKITQPMTNTCNIWSIFIYLPNKLDLWQTHATCLKYIYLLAKQTQPTTNGLAEKHFSILKLVFEVCYFPCQTNSAYDKWSCRETFQKF